MENNEELVLENTENVDELATEELVEGAKEEETEETPKAIYTEEDFNKKLDEVLAKKIARREAKIRKEYDTKYGKLENVLRAGTGIENVDEMTNSFTEYYSSKGINIPTTNGINDRDLERLGNTDAEDIISVGFEEVVEETDRLAKVGYDNMTSREKAMFKKLAEYRKDAEEKKELAQLGVTGDSLNEYLEFRNKLNPEMSEKEKYELYVKFKPKKDIEQIGSMKNTTADKKKDYYTMEEIGKLTSEELDDPDIWNAVMASMQK